MPLNEYNEDIKQARLKGHGEKSWTPKKTLYRINFGDGQVEYFENLHDIRKLYFEYSQECYANFYTMQVYVGYGE